MKNCKHEWRSQFDLPIPGEWVVCKLCGLNSGRVEPYEAKRPSDQIRERALEIKEGGDFDYPHNWIIAIYEHLDSIAGFPHKK